MPRGSLLLIFILLVAFAIAGSTRDSIEIDEQVYAIMMGVDKGVENRIRVTVQYPVYKGGGGSEEAGGGGMEKGEGNSGEGDVSGKVDNTVVCTVEAPSVLEAIDLLNTFTSRRISLVHLKEIVFSEEFAREGIVPYLEPITRFRETRRTMLVAVCRGRAEEYVLQNRTLIGESISKSMELMASQHENTGYFPHATFFDFYRHSVSTYAQPYMAYIGLNDFEQLKPLSEAESPLNTQRDLLPGEIPRTGDVKRELLGTAVFNGDKMVGILNGYETRYFLMVTGQFKRGMFSLEDANMPGRVIPVDLRLARRPKIKVTFDNDIPVIDIDIHVEADLGAIQSRIHYEDLNKIHELNDMIKNMVENGIRKVIDKTQREFGVDIFGFGYHASRHFFTIDEFEQYDWLTRYKDATVNIHVGANVRRTGLLTESSPIRYSK